MAVTSMCADAKFFALQLNMAKDSETVLEGFYEGPLKFPPTYKFDVGTNTYDTRLVMPGDATLNFGMLTKYHSHNTLLPQLKGPY